MPAGSEPTVKFTPLLVRPPVVTATFPLVAPLGTEVTMLVALQLVVAAVMLLNVTVPEAPKFVPVMVTCVPTGPEFGFKFVMVGAVPPPLPASRKAPRTAPQTSDDANVA